MGLLGMGVRDEAIEAIEPIAEVGGVMSSSVLYASSSLTDGSLGRDFTGLSVSPANFASYKREHTHQHFASGAIQEKT
jgi:hypothetical protein